jgi:hypothetical protein
MESIYNRTENLAAMEAVGSELARNERLLWAGKPAGGIKLQLEDFMLIPFSIIWAGFAIFWEILALTSGAPLLFALWGIPFVLAGIYLLIGRFVADAMQRGRTYYGVTDQRAIIITGWSTKNVQSIALHTLPDVSLKAGSGDRGTITFGLYPFWMPFATNVRWPGARRYTPPAFVMIPGAREVYDIIQQAQMDARQPRQQSGWETWQRAEEDSGASTRAL